MELLRANWLEKKLTRSKVRAMAKAIKSGTPSQMPWTDLPLGLSRACSTEAEPHKVRKVKGAVECSRRCDAFISLIFKSLGEIGHPN